MSLLKAEGLCKSYKGRQVVKEANIEVSAGEVVGLLGPNGAGKTTIFYMVVGFIWPDAGSVFLADQVITAVPMYRRARLGIGYLPQETSVFRKLTVEENILAILETMDIPKGEQEKRLRNILTELGLSHLGRNKAQSLSGGEKRRLEIARMLVGSPKFILFDEPFAGIDPKAVDDIQSIISSLKKKGIGILLTDHSVRDILEITDRSYIINEGEILISGPPDKLVNDEKVKQIYLGEKFKL
jgi:lipopolysaccharide export system ATP-binding protein